jgi:hypothetical protein
MLSVHSAVAERPQPYQPKLQANERLIIDGQTINRQI